jgi:hypothetical protein
VDLLQRHLLYVSRELNVADRFKADSSQHDLPGEDRFRKDVVEHVYVVRVFALATGEWTRKSVSHL